MKAFKKSLAVLLSVVILFSVMTVPVFAASGNYYVAGTEALCGANWEAGNSANIMKLGDDGLYFKTYQNVPAASNYQFKITQETWNNNWGLGGLADGQNIVFDVTKKCDVTITFNANTKDIKVEGDGVRVQKNYNFSYITAVGDSKSDSSFLNGIDWDPTAKENRMATEYGAVYTITYKGVAKNNGYQVKFAANGAWTDNWGTSASAGEGVAVYGTSSSNISFDVKYNLADVTLTLDLTNFDYNTGSGATYKIEVAEVKEEVPTEGESSEGTTTDDPTPTTTDDEKESDANPSAPTTPSGSSSSFKFTNNRGWSKVYAYFFDESGDLATSWPGDLVTKFETNSLGETVYTINVPKGATGCVINNGSGEQTTDITDFSVEGYYTDGSTNSAGHYIAIPWPGEGGGDSGWGGPGGDYDGSFKFTNNRKWRNVYAYFFGESGDLINPWPGSVVTEFETNSLGETVYTINVPKGAIGCVINNGSGEQTTDITDFSVEGYYTDGSIDINGYYIAIPWPGGSGEDKPASDPTTPSTSGSDTPTEPLPTPDPDGINFTTTLNGAYPKAHVAYSSPFTVTYYLTASEMIAFCQGRVTYDETKF
ncbi:MAG: starch-binding protein, partial [Ruminococcus sp.]|nr:starch-binding protein [Ruminococcus sp.]